MSNLTTYKRVMLDGKEKLLKLDYNSVSDLEEYYNKGFHAILSEEQIGFRLVRAFYWAALKWKEPGLTMDKVGYWLNKEIQETDKNIGDLMAPVMDALKKSRLLGTPEKDETIEGEYEDLEENENPNE